MFPGALFARAGGEGPAVFFGVLKGRIGRLPDRAAGHGIHAFRKHDERRVALAIHGFLGTGLAVDVPLQAEKAKMRTNVIATFVNMETTKFSSDA